MKISRKQLRRIIREAMEMVTEDCSATMVDSLTLDTTSMGSYPLATTGDEGRMMDYGSQKSDSHEGRMSKAKLFRMGQMAQSLEARLHDDDDLPEWVQDKVTTAEDRLRSAFDYIDYKLHRMKAQGVAITESNVRMVIRNSLKLL